MNTRVCVAVWLCGCMAVWLCGCVGGREAVRMPVPRDVQVLQHFATDGASTHNEQMGPTEQGLHGSTKYSDLTVVPTATLPHRTHHSDMLHRRRGSKARQRMAHAIPEG